MEELIGTLEIYEEKSSISDNYSEDITLNELAYWIDGKCEGKKKSGNKVMRWEE